MDMRTVVTVANGISTMKYNLIDRNKLTIVCTCNTAYLNYLYTFLQSIHTNSPDVNVIVRLVNVSKKEFQTNTNIFSNVYCFYDNTTAANNKILIDDAKVYSFKNILNIIKSKSTPGSPIFKSNEGIYCSNIKFNTINNLLSDGFECLVYLDVDTLVRKDIRPLKKLMKGYDLGMFINEFERGDFTTKYGHEYSGWNAGIMLVNSTPKAIKFYNQLEERVKSDMDNIDADEIEFEYMYRHMVDDIKLLEINKTFKDNGPDYNTESHMWSGQSEEKKLNKLYIRESQNYLYEYKKACIR